jgi:tyrosyl-tRNA synthetase
VRHEIPDDIETVELDGSPVHVPALIAGAFGTSSSEARRLIAQGAVKIDGEPLAADAFDLPADQLAGRVLQVGRRRFVRLADHA